MKEIRYIIIGLLFVILGVLALFSSPESLARYLGCVLVLSVLFEVIYVYSGKFRVKFWDIVGVSMGLLLGILLLAGGAEMAHQLPVYVGGWLMLRTLLTANISLDMRDTGNTNWKWVLLVSVIGAVMSFLVLFNPDRLISIWVSLALACIGLLYIPLSGKLSSLVTTR